MGMKIGMKTAVPVMILACVLAVSAILIFGFSTPAGSHAFVKAVYGSVPRTASGQANITELFHSLEASGSNTYNYILTRPLGDFEELKSILPAARERGIMVWVTILPPSELSPERRFDMDYVDYIGWGRQLAELSLQHDNLEAWSIDNVLVDHDFFTPGYLEGITGAAHEINPKLKFIPVVYYPNVKSPYFDDTSKFFDGMQFYYTNFPAGESNESAVLLPQLATLKTKFNKPVILGIYATPWSPDYPTSPEYVEQLINLAKQHTDGVMIYTMNQEAEKLAVIKRLFSEF